MLRKLYIYILVHGVSGAHKWDWNLLIESDEPPRDVVVVAWMMSSRVQQAWI